MTSGGQCVMTAGTLLMPLSSASNWDMHTLEVSHRLMRDIQRTSLKSVQQLNCYILANLSTSLETSGVCNQFGSMSALLTAICEGTGVQLTSLATPNETMMQQAPTSQLLALTYLSLRTAEWTTYLLLASFRGPAHLEKQGYSIMVGLNFIGCSAHMYLTMRFFISQLAGHSVMPFLVLVLALFIWTRFSAAQVPASCQSVLVGQLDPTTVFTLLMLVLVVKVCTTYKCTHFFYLKFFIAHSSLYNWSTAAGRW